jgi:hypothetical protein
MPALTPSNRVPTRKDLKKRESGKLGPPLLSIVNIVSSSDEWVQGFASLWAVEVIFL